jgi:hypothetical protein
MPTTRYSLRTLRSPVEGESRTLCSKDYIVISVVALVEGVRHAGGSPSPELVLAEAFGRHVETWNGRPLVVNHPVNAAGKAVLASSPDILESSYLGTLMGAKVEDGKLIVEAWLDVNAIEASQSDAVIDMWKRLVDGETVEVSVGAIVYTKRGDGEFEDKKYSGSWDIVIPDHLAFLDGGQIGACSVEDGCGTFRTHSVGSVRLSSGARKKMAGALKTVKSGAVSVASEGDGTKREACDCGDKKGLVAGQVAEAQVKTGKAWARMLWNAETFDHDRRSAMQRALTEKFGSMKSAYVVTFNDTKVVFEQFCTDRFALYEMEYESDGENNITFSGDAVEVVLQSKTVPVAGNKGKKEMSKALQSLAAKSKGKAKDQDEEDAEDGADDESTENADGTKKKSGKKKMSSEVSVPTHILSLAEKLDEAETLEDIAKALDGTGPGKKLRSAMKVCESARKQAIKVIRSSAGGKGFTDDMLADMSFEALQQTAVAFLAADRRAEEVLAADAGLDEGEELEEEGEELEEVEDGEVEGLSAIMDLEGQAERLNAPPPKKKTGVPAKTARLAAPGKASYGGRAAAGGGGHGRPPVAPNIFNFDDNGDFIGKDQNPSQSRKAS